MKKILIVEDEQMLRESYELILSTELYEVHSAADGSRALRVCDNHKFDLILLDLMMPVMDGVEFLKHYKQKTEDIPKVIILSNLSSGEELTTAMELGAQKNFIKADLSPKQLVAMVKYELQDS